MTVLSEDVLSGAAVVPLDVLDHLSALLVGVSGSEGYEAKRRALREGRVAASSARLAAAGVPVRGSAPTAVERASGRLDVERTTRKLRESGILVETEEGDELDGLDGPELAAVLHREIEAGVNDVSPIPLRVPLDDPDGVAATVALAKELGGEVAAQRAEMRGLVASPSAEMVESGRRLRESTRRAKAGDRR
jgi:hypothetical protein